MSLYLARFLRAISLRPKRLAEVIPLRRDDEAKKTIVVTVKLDMTEAKQQILELIDLANEAKSIAESIEHK